jgi:hypothetical protein
MRRLTTFVILACCALAEPLTVRSWQLAAAVDPQEPLLPRLDSLAFEFAAVACPDASKDYSFAFVQSESTTLFASSPPVGFSSADAGPSAASIGSAPAYAFGSSALPWRLRDGYSLTVSLSLAAPSFEFDVSGIGLGPRALRNHNNAYESRIDKSGSPTTMSTDPLCNGGTASGLFRCCAVSAVTYSVYFLGFNATMVTCTDPPPATNIIGGSLADGNLTLALSLNGNLTLKKNGAVFASAGFASSRVRVLHDDVASRVIAQTSLEGDSGFDVGTDSGWAAVRATQHTVNATLSASPALLAFLNSARQRLAATDSTAAYRWCRAGGADTAPEPAAPNTSAPFFVPSWAFGTTRNKVGYDASKYPADKDCSAPMGLYTTVGGTFSAYDQFAAFRASNRVEGFLPGCVWPAATSSTHAEAGAAVDTYTANATAGTVGALRSLALRCADVGGFDIRLQGSVALRAASLDVAVTRQFPVYRVVDSYASAAIDSSTVAPSSATSTCGLRLSVTLDVMNVDEFSPQVPPSFGHLATYCHPTDPGACVALLGAGSSTAWNPAAPVAGVAAFAAFRAVRFRLARTVSVSDALIYDSAMALPSYARGLTYVQLIETVALQSIVVEIPWTVNLTESAALCGNHVGQGTTSNPIPAMNAAVGSDGINVPPRPEDRCPTVDFSISAPPQTVLVPAANPWWAQTSPSATASAPSPAAGSLLVECVAFTDTECQTVYPSRPTFDNAALRCVPPVDAPPDADQTASDSVTLDTNSASVTASIQATSTLLPYLGPRFGVDGSLPWPWASLGNVLQIQGLPTMLAQDHGSPMGTATPPVDPRDADENSVSDGAVAAGATLFSVDLVLAIVLVIVVVIPDELIVGVALLRLLLQLSRQGSRAGSPAVRQRPANTLRRSLSTSAARYREARDRCGRPNDSREYDDAGCPPLEIEARRPSMGRDTMDDIHRSPFERLSVSAGRRNVPRGWERSFAGRSASFCNAASPLTTSWAQLPPAAGGRIGGPRDGVAVYVAASSPLSSSIVSVEMRESARSPQLRQPGARATSRTPHTRSPFSQPHVNSGPPAGEVRHHHVGLRDLLPTPVRSNRLVGRTPSESWVHDSDSYGWEETRTTARRAREQAQLEDWSSQHTVG